MRRERRHIALVHDERGTVIGLLTLEDLLEELVGDIEDEFDPRGRELVRTEDGRLMIDGETPLRTLARRVDVDLDDQHEATVGGYVAQRVGRLPEVGEIVQLDGVRLEVCAVEGTRVTQFALVPEPADGR
jgi:putative hemolysin